MSNPAFPAIPHFVRRTPFWNMLMAKISGIGILWFGQLSQNALFVFRGLLDPVVEFVAGGVFYILLPGREGRKE